MVAARFEWDDRKDAANRAKHRVGFGEAPFAFADPRRVIAMDGGVLTVRFTYREGVVRIIGAGYWRRGRVVYEQANQLHE